VLHVMQEIAPTLKISDRWVVEKFPKMTAWFFSTCVKLDQKRSTVKNLGVHRTQGFSVLQGKSQQHHLIFAPRFSETFLKEKKPKTLSKSY